jgi:succinate dehydrogenase / fumarate reductase cytochrome b subunit
VATAALTRQRGVQPVRQRRRRLPFPLNVYQTSVGKKWVMAITGLGLLGFVFVHMLGNLKFYAGYHGDHRQIDVYGEFLRDMLVPLLPRTWALWGLRLGLIACFVLHIHAAWGLTVMNRRANVNYHSKRDFIAANFASRTMRVSGVIVLVFVFFHLADLTWGWTHGDFVRGSVAANMVASMSQPAVALIYVIGNTLLAAHIYHGLWSAFQTLGLSNPRYNPFRRGVAAFFALTILIGNLSFPITIFTGIAD